MIHPRGALDATLRLSDMDEALAPRTPAPDDTAAFQRFYAGDNPAPSPPQGLLYRLLIGWWRDRD